MRDLAIRTELVKYGRRLIDEGLVTGPGGNLSARAGAVAYLSPSGYAFDELRPEDYVGIEIASGEIVAGEHRPTSEFLMHLACYRRRPDIGAVVHTHPRYTIAMSSAGHDIKAMFADFHIYTMSRIPHIDYITVTTPEMARAVEAVVEDANVIILRNHGAVSLGRHLKEAYYRMASLEEGAQIQWLATVVGKPRFLTEKELSDLDRLGSEQYRRQLLAAAKKT
ncbi:MAG: class II aldolase/adducin family protein [Desulfobacterales bacterium]|nr:MAG: class II aldolase/adducin family protein [Desulfobacterales bacterium]